MLNRLNQLNIISFRNLFIPVALEYVKIFVEEGCFEYKSLYIFGVRVARWRVNI